MQTYTTGWISKKLGVKYETLRNGMREGFVAPSIAVSEGQGHANVYSLSDVFRIVVFKRLSHLGFSRAVAAEMTVGVSALREKIERSFVYHPPCCTCFLTTKTQLLVSPGYSHQISMWRTF